MKTREYATVSPAEGVPGLYDIRTTEGREWLGLSERQVLYVIVHEDVWPAAQPDITPRADREDTT